MRASLAAPALIVAASVAMTDVSSDNSLSLELEGYAYLRYSVYGSDGSVPDDAFVLRRAGLKADFELPAALSGQLQVETRTDEVFLKDCYVDLAPLETAEARVGLFKVPFCRATMVGSWELRSPEHAICDDALTGLAYAGRDLGAMVSARPIRPLRAFLCLSNGGPPEDAPDDREQQYAARAELDGPGGLRLGAGLTRLRVGEADPSLPQGYVRSAVQRAWSSDLSWSFVPGPRVELGLAGEYAEADNWLDAAVLEGEDPPLMRCLWTSAYVDWYPRSAGRIDRIDLSVRYERLDPGGGEATHQVISPTVGAWPADTWRVRLGGMTHLFSTEYGDDYTDIVLELGMVF
jgi:hypothetical protein